MTTLEESRVLASLRQRPFTTVEDLARSCGQAAGSVSRVLAQPEWAGCVVVYRDRAGSPTGVQLNHDGRNGRTIH
jgi:DNA-binding MarR family transcriptional regulator